MVRENIEACARVLSNACPVFCCFFFLQQNQLSTSVLGSVDAMFSGGGNSNVGINMLTALAALTSNNSGNNTLSSSGGLASTVSPPFSADATMFLDELSSKQTYSNSPQPSIFDLPKCINIKSEMF